MTDKRKPSLWEKFGYDKGLIENIFSLALLQAFNLIIPILLIPLLYKKLGVEMFGMIMVSQALAAYFIMVIDFGFNLSTTRFVSVNRNDNAKISEAFSAVLLLKIFICFFCFIFYYFIIRYFSNYQEYEALFLLTYILVIGQSLFPAWFYQGMERMKYITIINSGLKIAASIMILLLIKDKTDYFYYPLLYGVSSFIAAIITIRLAVKKFQVRIYRPGIKTLYWYLKESLGFFLSRIAVTSYTTLNILVLSMYISPTAVGFYSVSEKLYMAIRTIYQPVSTALYPYISHRKNISAFKKIFFILLIVNILLVAALYFLSPWIIYIATGGHEESSVQYLKLFAILILIIMPSVFIGYPLLGAMGFTNVVNRSVLFPASLHVALIILLVLTGHVTALNVISVLFVTEILVLLYRGIAVIKTKILH
jgi:PST family polysaccharide transporter